MTLRWVALSRNKRRPHSKPSTKIVPWFLSRVQQEFLERVGEEQQYKILDDFYKVRSRHFFENKGASLMGQFDHNIPAIFKSAYPKHHWEASKFQYIGYVPRTRFEPQKSVIMQTIETPPDYILESDVSYIIYCEEKLGIKEISDWHQVSVRDMCNLGGWKLLSRYQRSVYTFLKRMYPDHAWRPWRFPDQTLQGYFWTQKNRKRFLKDVALKYNVKKPEDWYGIGDNEILAMGGKSLLQKHGQSLHEVIRQTFPSIKLYQFNFLRCFTPLNYWADVYRGIEFMYYIEEQLNIKNIEDWYKYTYADVFKYNGSGLMSRFATSLPDLLAFFYPEFAWLPWRFSRVSRNMWADHDTQMAFKDVLSKKYGYNKPSEWTNLTTLQVRSSGGAGFLSYTKSLKCLLETIVPEIDWSSKTYPHHEKKPTFYWQDPVTCKAFLNGIKDKLGIVKAEDWYRVSVPQLTSYGGSGIVNYWPFILEELHPEVKWEWTQFSTVERRTQQRALYICIKSIFPELQILEEYTMGAVVGSSTSQVTTLDIFLPKLNIAIEYQGEHHYMDVYSRFGPVGLQQARDSEKSALCNQNGVTLIQVPYWWNVTDFDTIVATIKYYRPELELEVPEGALPFHLQVENAKAKPGKSITSSFMGALNCIPNRAKLKVV